MIDFELKRDKMPLWRLLIFFILLLFGPSVGQVCAHTPPQIPLKEKKILILNAHESSVPAFRKTNHGISRALETGGIRSLNQFYEHLDIRRNPGPAHRKSVLELLHRRYDQRRIDFIITLYADALEFLLNEAQAVFPEAPVLALYLPQGYELPDTARPIIPHVVVPDLTRTIEIALKVVPTVKRVYVVSGVHPYDRWLDDKARQDFKQWEDRLEFRYLNDLPLEEILAASAAAPLDSVIIITSFAMEVSGRPVTTVEVSRQLARVSKAPVFGVPDTLLGEGIVGGSLISLEHIGTKAGELAVDFLSSAPHMGNVPTVLEVSQVEAFDWRQLRHWNLKESALPKGSLVINKEYTLWDFRHYVISALAFMAAQSLLIAGLLINRRRRRSAEVLLEKKTVELEQFFNISMDLLCIANTDGYFLQLNPIWEKTLGYSREELMARRFFDFVHPDDLASTREVLSALTSQQTVIHFENRYKRQDGAYCWLEWASAPFGKLIYAAARDITERKAAEAAVLENLRFERLASNISAGFVDLPVEKIDHQIQEGLRTVAEFFGADRCTIGLFTDGGARYVRALEYRLPEAEPGPESLTKEQTPWYLEQLIQGNSVIMNRLEDLPPEAEKERRLCLARGMKSLLSIPMVSRGKTLGSCVLVSTRSALVWPKEIISRFRLVTEVFGNALERKWSEQVLEERLRFERLLSGLSGRFAIIAPEQVDTGLRDSLKEALEFFQVDRIGLLSLSKDKNFWFISHAASAAGIEPLPVQTELSKSLFPWMFDKIVNQEEAVSISDVLDLPQEAQTDKESLGKWGIRSILNVPVFHEERVSCVSVTADRRERNWPDEYIFRLRLIGDLLFHGMERKKLTERIRKAAQEWQATFDSIPDVVMILDRDLRILRHNASAVSFFELPPQGIVGQHCHHLMHGANEPPPDCPTRKSLSTRGHQEHEVYDGKRKAWFLVASDPIIGNEGEVTQIVHRIKDITSQKRVEMETMGFRRELQQSDRSLRMGELAASLAHELNQPLTSIMSNANAALRFIEADRFDLEEFKEILEDIAADDKRAGGIIRSLRSMFKQEEGEREQTPVNPLLQEVIALFKSEAITRRVQVATEFEDLLPPVTINKIQIQQVVLNLLMNAAESIPDDSPERKITIRTQTLNNGFVQVAVSDTGSGINEGNLAKIFEPFFTSKRSGIGMGLSISRNIIETHGGHIRAENNPDKGATVFFDLPA